MLLVYLNLLPIMLRSSPHVPLFLILATLTVLLVNVNVLSFVSYTKRTSLSLLEGKLGTIHVA